MAADRDKLPAEKGQGGSAEVDAFLRKLAAMPAAKPARKPDRRRAWLL